MRRCVWSRNLKGRRPWPALGRSATGGKFIIIFIIIIIIIKGKGVLVHSMSACRGVDLQLFSFLTLAVNEIE